MNRDLDIHHNDSAWQFICTVYGYPIYRNKADPELWSMGIRGPVDKVIQWLLDEGVLGDEDFLFLS